MTAIVTTIDDVRRAVQAARDDGKRIGFVPTMGALHSGHARLVELAAERGAFVVVSIFVNPTQFGPNEDFSRYPRTLDADRLLCANAGASLIFAPSPSEMYPEDFSTYVEVGDITDVLCGPSRPGHFRGVATVVLKLFHIVQPDFTVFGQKDAQQVLVVQRMVRDLSVPIEVVVAPTVREADGLAMSSRNRYLDPDQRREAAGIYRALQAIEAQVAAGERDVARLEAELRSRLTSIPGSRLDYARILDAETLQPITRLERPALAAIALFLGTTRLIDNTTLTPS